MGAYFTDGNAILIQADDLRSLWARGCGHLSVGAEDLFRLLLVHEATHALDAQRHPTLDGLCDEELPDGPCSWTTLIEGHAEYVVFRVAYARGLFDAFETYLSCFLHAPRNADPFHWEREIAASEGTRQRYARGRLLFQAALDVGGDALVDDLLRRPPSQLPPPDAAEDWLRERQRDLERRRGSATTRRAKPAQ